MSKHKLNVSTEVAQVVFFPVTVQHEDLTPSLTVCSFCHEVKLAAAQCKEVIGLFLPDSSLEADTQLSDMPNFVITIYIILSGVIMNKMT